MFPRKYKKQSKIKRFLLKLFNVHVFEKETLNIVNPDYKNSGNNFFKLNDKSLILSTGYLDLDRKIRKLDIFYRYSPNNQLWNSTKRWKRIVPDINKKDLISTSIISLKESILKFLENNKLDITIHLISDDSEESFDKGLINILANEKIKIEKNIRDILKEETDLGIKNYNTYQEFAKKVYKIRDNVRKNVAKLKEKNNNIVGYGSPAKATTALNFFGIFNEIDFIIEDNKLKQGKFLPGVKIPIKSKLAILL